MKLSICMPTYNGERFVNTALQSVIDQSERDFELIVNDDCSTDATLQVTALLEDARLRVSANDKRLGLVGNWNRCIELAMGPYIIIFHQDDMMHEDFVDRVLDKMICNDNIGFAFTNIVTIDESGAPAGGHWDPSSLPASDTVFCGKDFFRLLLQKGNFVPCQAVVVRAACYDEAGLFDNRLHYTPDYEMWLRLALRYDVAYLAQPLVALRRHSEQESRHYLGLAEEVLEVWQAIQIVFSEQHDRIPNKNESFELAITHLQEWTQALLRDSLRRAQFADARSLAKCLAKFAWTKHIGLSSR